MKNNIELTRLFDNVVYNNKSPFDKFINVLDSLDEEERKSLLTYFKSNLDYSIINEYCGVLHDQIRLGLEENSPKSRWMQYEAELQPIQKIADELKQIMQEVEILLQQATLELNEEKIQHKKNTARHIRLDWKLKRRDFLEELHDDLIDLGFIDTSFDEFYSHFQKDWNEDKILWKKNIKLAVALFHLLGEFNGFIDSRPSHELVFNHFYKEKISQLSLKGLENNRSTINMAIQKRERWSQEVIATGIKGIEIIVSLIEKYMTKYSVSPKV